MYRKVPIEVPCSAASEAARVRARQSTSWWSPLRHRTYRNLWLFSCLSSLGAIVQSTGAAWMMASLGGSAMMVSLIAAAVTIPPVILSIPAGVLADLVSRRKIMLWAQCFMMLVSVLLAVLTWLGKIDAAFLLLFTFLIGCGQAVNTPAWMASISDMVPRRDLPAAIMLNSIGANVTRTAGPAVGGFILAAAGASANFAFNAVSYLGEILVLLRWRPPSPALSHAPRHTFQSVLSSTAGIGRLPAMRRLAFDAVLFGSVASALPALLPVAVRASADAGAVAFGLCLALFGLGALIAGGCGNTMRSRFGSEGLLLLSLATTAAALAGACLFHEHLVILALTMAVSGAGWVWGFAGLTIEAQTSAPTGSEGRALALYQFTAFIGLTIGNLGWGALTDLGGFTAAFAAAATGSVAGMIAVGLRKHLPAPTS